MTIRAEQITVYHVTCDDCGVQVGPVRGYDSATEAADELADHRQRSVVHRAIIEGRMARP